MSDKEAEFRFVLSRGDEALMRGGTFIYPKGRVFVSDQSDHGARLFALADSEWDDRDVWLLLAQACMEKANGL